MSVQILPELRTRPVTVDGYAVPRVSAHEIPSTGQWNVIYDGRFCVLAESLEELTRWLRVYSIGHTSDVNQ